jgi:hypothetical protein
MPTNPTGGGGSGADRQNGHSPGQRSRQRLHSLCADTLVLSEANGCGSCSTLSQSSKQMGQRSTTVNCTRQQFWLTVRTVTRMRSPSASLLVRIPPRCRPDRHRPPKSTRAQRVANSSFIIAGKPRRRYTRVTDVRKRARAVLHKCVNKCVDPRRTVPDH